MAWIQFGCVRCGATAQVDASLAGQPTTCPACGLQQVAPAAADWLPPTSSPPVPPPLPSSTISSPPVTAPPVAPPPLVPPPVLAPPPVMPIASALEPPLAAVRQVEMLLPPGVDPTPTTQVAALPPVDVLLPPTTGRSSTQASTSMPLAPLPTASPRPTAAPQLPQATPGYDAALPLPSAAVVDHLRDPSAPSPLTFGAGPPQFGLGLQLTPSFGGEAEANRIKEAWKEKTRRRARNNAIAFGLAVATLVGALYALLKLTAQGP